MPNLLSINAGIVQPLFLTTEADTQSLVSAIRKSPLLGTVSVNRLGIAGDERADMSVHGGLDKAVYLYPHEHYPVWNAARERVLRLFEEQHIALNMVISLPSLDGIKRAVEMDLGVALLPRRCALAEIASKRLVAVAVDGISRKRQVTLVARNAQRSHAANAFLDVARVTADESSTIP